MAVPACVSCQEKLSCADSALSITGNVIGILTFVGAALISIRLHLNSLREANREIYLLSRRLESRIDEVRHLQNLLEIENETSGVLKEMLAPGVQRASTNLKDSESLLRQIRRGTGDERGRLRSSAKFVYLADDLKKCIEEADDVLGIVRGATNGALLHVVSTSAERIEEYLRQTSAQMERMKSDNHQNTYLLEELQSMKRGMGMDR